MMMYGGIPQLGNWNVDNAYAMSSYYYTAANANWFAALQLPAGLYFEYRYFKRNLNYSITWEGGANDVYTVPKGCAVQAIVNDQFRGA